MALDYHNHYLSSVRYGVATLIYPVQQAVHTSKHIFEGFFNMITERSKLIAENDGLKRQHLLNQRYIQRYEVLEAENQRLKRLLGATRHLTAKVSVAELLEIDLQSYRHRVLINKGSRDGAYIGQAIIDADGIVGQITDVGLFSSAVLLITDINHALPVQINRSGIHAIATGTGEKDRLQLRHLSKHTDVIIGDLIISSGLGRRFPFGYAVGKVSNIVFNDDFLDVTVSPSALFDRNREALMLWEVQ